jgi:hypothetical protein
MPLRIKDITEKFASNLSQANLIDDNYHNNIKQAARCLVEYDQSQQWSYVKQLANGVTLWKSMAFGQLVRVSLDGEIVRAYSPTFH